MKRNFPNNYKTTLVFLIVAFACFVGFTLFGIEPVAYVRNTQYYNNNIRYTYDYLELYYDLGGIYFISFAAVFFIAVIPIVIFSFKSILHSLVFKILTSILYGLILNVLLGQLIVYVVVLPYWIMTFCGVATYILLCHSIAAIAFLFVISLLRFKGSKATQNSASTTKQSLNNTKSIFYDAENKLIELKKLLDQGILTQEEYNKIKQKYISLL